ncbi:Conserved hypothetical protein [Prochlorococcus marinus str. NATL2A]|uniref:Uncharacterized protein n=1 Tax=Prochlorococcus marinus (strain NATL2A) TaxID=59920 RepID=A7MDT5_PROMT|nr:Conserved hypothetical protein [Prochlorococcus marinus str. NATL2A]
MQLQIFTVLFTTPPIGVITIKSCSYSLLMALNQKLKIKLLNDNHPSLKN